MSKKFSLKFSMADLFVIIGAAVFAVLILVFYQPFSGDASGELTACIYVDDRLIYRGETPISKLSDPQIIVVSKENYPDIDINGRVTVTIDPEKGVAITRSDCPNHDCVHQGFVKMENLPVVCAPNNVVAVLTSNSQGSNSPDAVIGMVRL